MTRRFKNSQYQLVKDDLEVDQVQGLLFSSAKGLRVAALVQILVLQHAICIDESGYYVFIFYCVKEQPMQFSESSLKFFLEE